MRNNASGRTDGRTTYALTQNSSLLKSVPIVRGQRLKAKYMTRPKTR